MHGLNEHARIRRFAIWLCGLAVLGLIAIPVMPHYVNVRYGGSSRLMTHLLMEMFAIVIAILIVTVSWHTVDEHDERTPGILIFGFLVVAVCELLHAFSYAGMPPFQSANSTPRAIFFWLMGRTFEVVVMWLLALNRVPAWTRSSALLLGLVVSALLVWFGSYDLEAFPASFVSGSGVTQSKTFYEFALSLLYIAAAMILWRRAGFSGMSHYYLFATSSFMMGVGEIAFADYATPSDLQDIFGHLYKLASYVLLYRVTFIISIRTPFELVRQTAKRLRESETRFRTVIERAPVGMGFARNGATVGVNPAYLQMFGYRDMADFGDKSLLEQIAPQCRHEVIERAKRRAQGKPVENTYEVMGLRKDGTQFPLLVSAQRLELDEGASYFAFLIDISDRKQAEAEQKRLQQQLVQAQKMESMGHLAGGIAHDFNNTLNAMLGYAQLLKLSGTSSGSSEDGRIQHYVDAILKAGNHAKDMIRQIMVFSRHKSGTDEGGKQLTRVAAVLNECINLLLPSIPDGIAVDYHFEELVARINPAQLSQILLNLVVNARDAIEGHGSINIWLRRFAGNGVCNACGRKFEGDYLELSVRDTGCGIPEQLLGSIFEPFFTTKPDGLGTGMGLSVVYGHVHDLGGHILVNSRLGQGATFSVLLPAANEDVGGDEEDVAVGSGDLNPQIAGLRVMVVDDEKSVSAMLCDLLSFHGARALAFDTPHAALQAFERNPAGVDLVITDQNMPGISGLQLARHMLELRSDLPVILCTGRSEHVDAEVAKRSGIAEFIYKPVDVSSLVECIANLCFNHGRGREAGHTSA